MKTAIIAALLALTATADYAPGPERDWWRAGFDGACTRIEQFGYRSPAEMLHDDTFVPIDGFPPDVAVFDSDNYGVMIFRRALSMCETAAHTLAPPANGPARWYTE